jgi:hypothetical protein
MLECYLARYQYREFRAELAGLVARQDLGSHRGEVRLQQAMEALASARKGADPPALIHEALALGLPPIEEAYAQALIAPTVPKVVEQLQRTARLAPFHRRTHEMLPAMLFLLGRLPEMREAVARLNLIAPQSISAALWQAQVLVLDDNLEAAHRECERLRPNLGDDGVVIIQLMMRMLHVLSRSEMAWLPDTQRFALLRDLVSGAPQLARLYQDSKSSQGAERWADFAMFRLPALQGIAEHPLFKNTGTLANLIAMTQPKVMSEAMSRFVATCPNGAFLWAQASWLISEGRLAEAEAVLARAMQTPSPFPVYRVALAELTALQFLRLDKTPEQERPQLRARIRASLRELAGRGVYPPMVSRNLAHIARSSDEPAIALVFSEASVRAAPIDRNALQDRFNSESALGAFARARKTMNELLAKSPENASLFNQRALVEYRQGAFGDAAASCFAALHLDPKVPDAAGNLTTIEAEVRRRQAAYNVVLEKLRLRAPLILAHQGRHAEAVKAVAAEKAEGDTAAALACLYAVASSAAAMDDKLSAAERSKQAEVYAVQAIDLLRRAQQAGYFKETPRAKYLANEHDYDILRPREDFKQVMAAVQK